jgi:hypothetical protein
MPIAIGHTRGDFVRGMPIAAAAECCPADGNADNALEFVELAFCCGARLEREFMGGHLRITVLSEHARESGSAFESAGAVR